MNKPAEAHNSEEKASLNDDTLDSLLERSPKLIEECEQIRQRMKSGQFHDHEEVKRLLG